MLQIDLAPIDSPCAFKNCSGIGRFRPTLKVPDLRDATKLGIELDVLVCDACTYKPVQAFVSDDGWGEIVKILRLHEIPIPHRTSIKIEFLSQSGIVFGVKDVKKIPSGPPSRSG